MKIQQSINKWVYRISSIIVKTIFVLLAIASWLLAIVIYIAGYPLYAFGFAAFSVMCVLLCKTRFDAGLIVFLCLCPIALPLALRQEVEADVDEASELPESFPDEDLLESVPDEYEK